jgi:hypothetical protein
MKTDDLIALLARQPQPVIPAHAARGLWLAAAAGIIVALAMLIPTLGLNPDYVTTAALEPMLWVKAVFVIATAAAGFAIVLRLARPGQPLGGWVGALVAPVVIVWLLAVIALLNSAPSERMPLVMGTSALLCPWFIAALSLPSFVGLMAAIRSLAPTRLRLAGAGAGLLAGALGACVYQLHCPEMAAPFIAVWYLLGMLIPAALGALIGPRVLRW